MAQTTTHAVNIANATALESAQRQRAEQTPDTVAREHTEPTGSCLVYRDCTETEPGHYDHFAHALRVTEDDGVTPIISAGMVALSDDDPHAVVYLRNAEFTDAAAVHAKTAELRRMLDEVDAMAVRVFADHEARG